MNIPKSISTTGTCILTVLVMSLLVSMSAGGRVISQPNERSFCQNKATCSSLSGFSSSDDVVVVNPNAIHSAERHAPPVHALYQLDIHIPVISQQRFQLRIISETVAELIIDGMLKINDQIKYEVQPATGELVFYLSDTTKGILKRFRTSVSHATYCPITDAPSIQIKPPLPTKLNLRLKRMNHH